MSYMNIPTSKLTNEELLRLPSEELVRRLRIAANERSKTVHDHELVVKDFNQRMQRSLVEIRSLKDVNVQLQQDNQELRDLCCFLDDERQKGRKLAKEWQKFGRYTSGVMRGEVGGYHDKLKELESRQQDLVTENTELKCLCVYLEEERLQLCKETSGDRDQGDGSSNSSASSGDKPELAPLRPSQTGPQQMSLDIMSSALPEISTTAPPLPTTAPPGDFRDRGLANGRKHTQNSEDTMRYVRQLEERIQGLEEEKKHLVHGNHGNQSNRGNQSNHSNQSTHSNNSNFSNEFGVRGRSRVISPSRADTHRFFSTPDASAVSPIRQRSQSWSRSRSPERQPSWNNNNSPNHDSRSQRSPNKPEAVLHAMKVLEIHEQLERAQTDRQTADDMDGSQKALIRGMCNVVWHKLGDGVPGYKTQV